MGLVASASGWDPRADAEWISGGVNSKGPGSAALARHANLFLWGFYGDPTRLTPSARNAFLNAIVYMKRFDGRTPLFGRGGQDREGYLSFTILAETVADPKTTDSRREQFASYLEEYVHAEAREDGKVTAAGIRRFHAANAEYLRQDAGAWVLDEDLRSIGLSNRAADFFERLAARLDADPADALATKALTRYAPGAPRDAKALRAWRAQQGDRLFFSDAGGYRWIVGVAPEPAKATRGD